MKAIKTLALLIVTLSSIFIFCGCENSNGSTVDPTNPTDMSSPSPSVEPSVNMPTPTENIDDLIEKINERVAYVNGKVGTGSHEDRYDERNRLIYRYGNEYYEAIEGHVFYRIYYDEEEHMIFADINQYRTTSYSIYFDKDIVIRLTKGEPTNEAESVFDDMMSNAIRMCLENAYK